MVHIKYSPQVCSSEDIEKYLEILNTRDESEDSELFLDIKLMLAKNNALAHIFTFYTGRSLSINENQDVSLELDLSREGDRDFIQNIPGMYSLILVKNFQL